MWTIDCGDGCAPTKARDIIALIDGHRDEAGWFICSRCQQQAFISKSFATQGGGRWTPFLKGAIRLGTPGEPYQPFAFLVGDEANGGVATSVWVAYYTDLRPHGGRLKMGHGPGGPPVLGMRGVDGLRRRLIELGCLDPDAE